MEAQLSELIARERPTRTDVSKITGLLDRLPIGYVVVSDFERITQINSHAKRFLFVALEPVINRSLFSLFKVKKQGMQMVCWITQRNETLSMTLSNGEKTRRLSFEKTEIAPREFIIIIRDDTARMAQKNSQIQALEQSKEREFALQNYLLGLSQMVSSALKTPHQSKIAEPLLLDLVGHLLDTERYLELSSDTLVTRGADLIFIEMVESVCAQYKLPQVELRIDSRQASFDKIHADASLLDTIIQNLVLFAQAHSASNVVHVMVSDSIDASQRTLDVELSFNYEGAALSEQTLAQLLDPIFANEPNAATDLRLALVNNAITHYAGKFNFEHQENGFNRVTVHLSLPLALCRQSIEPNDVNLIPDLSDKCVLLVDDNPVVAELMERMILPTRATIEKFTCPVRALQMIEEINPDLIITDIIMDGLDGVELLKKLRLLGIDKPVVAVTAIRSEQRLSELDKAGFAAVLTKPLLTKTLYGVLAASVR